MATGRQRTVVRRPSVIVDSTKAYVPPPAIGSSYVGRKVHGVPDMVLLDVARAQKKNVLLMGHTGAGKTLLGEAYASRRKLFYYSVPCDVSIDPTSLFGKMSPTETPGKFRWVDGPVTRLARSGGVLNISEINFMTPKIAASLYSLLDGRRYLTLLGKDGEIVRAHENLLIIADMNPEYRGTMELNAAFKNRFAIRVQWDYNNEVEQRLVKSATLRQVAEKLRQKVGKEISTPVSTNMLMELETLAQTPKIGLAFALENFVAAFVPDEREAVRNIVELNGRAIEGEIGEDAEFYTTDDFEFQED